jgi:hypothetical protein
MALTRRARRSNCSGRVSVRVLPCGRRTRRARLDGGLCQGIVSDGLSVRSDASSASSGLNRMTSLSACTTTLATNWARIARSRSCAAPDVGPSCWAVKSASRDFMTASSISAAGTRETDPAGAVLASPCRTGVDVIPITDASLCGVGWGPSGVRHRQTAVPPVTDWICCVRRCGATTEPAISAGPPQTTHAP